MRLYSVSADGLGIADVLVPEPGPGQVLVRVAGAGLCHSDCLIRSSPSVYEPSGAAFTLGHETAGWVESVGDGVATVRSGEPVVVPRSGDVVSAAPAPRGPRAVLPVYPAGPGSGARLRWRPGGVPARPHHPRAVVPLPDTLDPVDAGPLDDAALTPYHTIRTSMPWLEPGSVAVVIGIGGLGHAAVQLLRTLSAATIVAVEKDPRRRELALELGADVVMDSADDAAPRIKAMGHDGASFVLDLVGVDQTLAMAATSTAHMRKIVCVGAGLGSYPFSIITVPWECVLQTTYSGEVWELAQLVDLAAAGHIRIHGTRIALEDVPAAYDRLDHGEHGTGRLIAVP